jgi:hypothetical protein
MSESMKNKVPVVLVSVVLGQTDPFTEEVSSQMVIQDSPCVSVSVLSRYADADIGITIMSDGLLAIGERNSGVGPSIVRLLDLVDWAKDQSLRNERTEVLH